MTSEEEEQPAAGEEEEGGFKNLQLQAGSTNVGENRSTADTWYEHKAVRRRQETQSHVGNL